MSDTLDLTRRLVAIPSHEDERAAGDAVESWLRAETDAAVRRDDAGNVIARRGDGPRSLALVGHHDVVAPADEQITDGGEYVVTERDGRFHGRGTADMKGSLAAAMVAFRDADPAAELVFASFAGEEQGGVGARAAIDDGFAPDYAVVGEGSTGYSAPGVTDVAVAHKGRRGSTVVARGESAHASEPEAGENAVYRACDDADFAAAVLDAAREAQDGGPQRVAKPHATDAGWLAAAGTTCIVCGAAEPGEAHTAEESVAMDVLERCERIYRGVAESLYSDR